MSDENRGILKVPPEVLAQALGLEPGVRITWIRFDPFEQVAELLLEGNSLPEARPNESAPPYVVLNIRTDPDLGYVHRKFCHWEHAPAREWEAGEANVIADGSGGLL
ncbi:hypothetical protein CWB41_13910 [Methylovirgula ligni]|uniref:Uncharacterized protein n=1 Tax=Methylovirgula ligni TaxID=569860 RepID=A0A3D9YL12_9HYPH|nr:hypothetical protein [Methylovirgula ligni]QAY96689.1 hypothetical protein CWB41_13910 [Methylovirgula ligni]REF83270.1 hypothetical protein DES32_3186 [Methylovirgula ligni]